jgi:periplasmic nitrate reductase NapE
MESAQDQVPGSDPNVQGGESSGPSRKQREGRLFAFIIVFLFPILSVMVVGGYGLAVWIWQTLMGPPGPPG